MKIFVHLILLTGVNCLSNSTINIISTFLKENNSKLCFFLVCWSSRDLLRMHKTISEEKMYIRIAFLPVRKGSISDIRDENYEKIHFVLDLSCANTHLILLESSEQTKFRFVHNWLMISKSNLNNSDIRNLFKNIKLRMDMNVKMVIPRKYLGQYDVFEIYDPGLKVDFKINKVGFYNEGNITYFNKNISDYESRKNMTGVLIRTGDRANYTFSSEEEVIHQLIHREHGTFGKFHFQLFLNLLYIHNFHFNKTIRNEWFGNSSTGIEAGISQLLYENQIDISSAGGILRPARVHYYDYLLPYYKFRSSFFFRNPGSVQLGTDVLKPFALKTWYYTLGAVAAMGLATKAAYWVEQKFLNSKSRYTFFTSFLIIISLLGQQGSAIVPNRLGGRIIFLNILILAILLYNYYTSSLVSSLLSSKPPVINTIKELYLSKLKVGTEYQPYTITYIVQSKNDYYVQQLNSTKIFENEAEPNYFLPAEGLAKVKQGGFAYHTEVTTAYPIIARTFEQEYICDLAQINFVWLTNVALMTPKKSQYRQLFLVSLVKMQQCGIFKREHNVWVAKKPACLSDLRVVAVGINELFLVYLILVSGIIFATLVLFIEVIWYKLHDNVNLEFVN